MRQRVGQVPGTGRDLSVGPRHLLAEAPHLRGAGGDGRNVQRHGLHLAVGDCAAPTCHGDLAREVVGEVFFAAEGQLDGYARHLPGNLRRQRDLLGFQPVAEAAAAVLVVDMHQFRVQAGDLGHLFLDEARYLAA